MCSSAAICALVRPRAGPGQHDRLVEQVAGFPGPGQARRAGAPGPGQVPGTGEHDGQHKAARPGERAGDPGRDLPGLPGQPDRLVMIAGIPGAEAELVQGPQPRLGHRSPGLGPPLCERGRVTPALHLPRCAMLPVKDRRSVRCR